MFALLDDPLCRSEQTNVDVVSIDLLSNSLTSVVRFRRLLRDNEKRHRASDQNFHVGFD